MFYTVYKITNLVNDKYYIGKHQTKNINDGYMGSGKLIQRAILKYGSSNFKKQILFVFDNEDDMNAKEKELVVVSESTYNLCEGGKGGFGYINNNQDILSKRDTPENKRKGALAANLKGAHLKGSISHNQRIKTNPEYYFLWKQKVEVGKAKIEKKDCPLCSLKQLNPGNYTKHMKSKHNGLVIQ